VQLPYAVTSGQDCDFRIIQLPSKLRYRAPGASLRVSCTGMRVLALGGSESRSGGEDEKSY